MKTMSSVSTLCSLHPQESPHTHTWIYDVSLSITNKKEAKKREVLIWGVVHFFPTCPTSVPSLPSWTDFHRFFIPMGCSTRHPHIPSNELHSGRHITLRSGKTCFYQGSLTVTTGANLDWLNAIDPPNGSGDKVTTAAPFEGVLVCSGGNNLAGPACGLRLLWINLALSKGALSGLKGQFIMFRNRWLTTEEGQQETALLRPRTVSRWCECFRISIALWDMTIYAPKAGFSWGKNSCFGLKRTLSQGKSSWNQS